MKILIQSLADQNLRQEVFTRQKTYRLGVSASNSGHELQELLRLLQRSELVDQFAHQIKLFLIAALHCVIEHQNAHAVEEYDPALESEELARILCFLLKANPCLVWVVAQRLHLLLARQIICFLDRVPNCKASLLVQHARGELKVAQEGQASIEGGLLERLQLELLVLGFGSELFLLKIMDVEEAQNWHQVDHYCHCVVVEHYLLLAF